MGSSTISGGFTWGIYNRKDYSGRFAGCEIFTPTLKLLAIDHNNQLDGGLALAAWNLGGKSWEWFGEGAHDKTVETRTPL